MPTQSARSRSRSRGCDRSKSSQTLTLLQVKTLNTAQHSAAQHPIPSHSDQSTVTGGDQLPVASCQSRQRMSGQKGEHKRHRMRTISSAAASERVRVMEGNEGVDRPKGKRVEGGGSRGNVRGKVSRQRQHENYRLRCRVASGADADARLPREISQ